jgi:lipoprotein-releasing system ATP-binding protein
LLKVTDLHKSFPDPLGGEIHVLRGASFETCPGEMIAVRGASGAGKSTLLHLIGGIETVDHGTILLDDFDVAGADVTALERYRAQRIGFVFQFHHLLPDLTAMENVAMPLLINRESRAQSLSIARNVLGQFGLGDRASHAVGSLSGGEQQRTAIARALVMEPRLVLADEPTGNLDSLIGEEIENTLRQYCRRKRAIVLLATHNAALAAGCDRQLLLRKGVLEEQSACELKSVYPS